jgi:hypothetical protein
MSPRAFVIRANQPRRPCRGDERKAHLVLYTLLIYADPAKVPGPETPEGQSEFAGWMSITDDITEAGIMRGGSALHPTPTATTLRVRDGETLLTDGPFAETKEVLGGFYLIDVPDIDAATAWAAKMPHVDYGSVEIRPVMTFD